MADLVDAVNIVSQLKGKTYTWKSDEITPNSGGGRRVIGLIAQEVRRVLPGTSKNTLTQITYQFYHRSCT